MANHILAVHLGTESIGLAVARSTLRTLRIQLLASLDPRGEAVRDVVASRPWDRIIAGVPAEAAAFRVLSFPFREHRKLSQAVGPALEAHVPFSLDDAVPAWDFAGNSRRGPILAAMMPRDALSQHRESLAEIGIVPDRMLWAPSATLEPYRRVAGPQSTYTVVDLGAESAVVACFVRGRLSGLRVAARADDETTVRNVGWFLRTLEPSSPRVLIGGPRADVLLPALCGAAPGLQFETLPEDCVVDVTESAAPAWRSSTTVVGLVLAAGGVLDPPVIEFSEHHVVGLAPSQMRTAARRLAPWAGAATALAVLAGGLDYARLGRQHRALETRALRIYRSVMPDAPSGRGYRLKMQVRASELEQRLSEGGQAGQSATPLAVLADLSRTIPAELKVEFDIYAYDPPVVRLRGRSESFEAVTRLQEALRGSVLFGASEVDDVRAAVAGGVEFELTLKLHDEGRPA